MCVMDSLCSSSLSHSVHNVCARVCHVNALDWNFGFKGILWNFGKYARLLAGREVRDHSDDEWSQCSHLTLDKKANKHISQNVELLPQGDSLVDLPPKIWGGDLTCNASPPPYFTLPTLSVFMINGMLSDSYNLYKIDQIGWFYDILFHS